MNRRQLLTGALGAPLLGAAAPKLNVVFFMTDDHGYWASSPYGCADIHTPNLQRLADGVPGADALVTASVDLAGAPGAFETLRTPGDHGKILVKP